MFLTNWLKGLYNSVFKPTEVISQTAIKNVPAVPGIQFCANYDGLTAKATQIMQEIADEIGLPTVSFKVLLKADLTKDVLEAERSTIKQKGRLEIFCGHGTPEVLLGPYISDTEEIIRNNTLHSPLYTEEMIPNGGVALLAFCCSSGSVLGTKFIYHPGNSFMGFKSLIFFYFNDNTFMEKFGEILKATIMTILVSEKMEKGHKNQLYDLYTQVIRYFKFGEGRRLKKSFEYSLLFADQRQKLTYMEFGQVVQ